FSSRRRHTRFSRDWSSDVCSSDLAQIRLAADHDIQPARQRATEGIPGLAAHDDRLAEGHGLEVLEVRRQVPGHLVVETDHPVAGQGGDHGEGKSSAIHGRENNAGMFALRTKSGKGYPQLSFC